MNGIDSDAHSSFNWPAVSKASWRDSTTHGPAMTNNGCWRPASKWQSFMVRSAGSRTRERASGDVLEPICGHQLARQCRNFDLRVVAHGSATTPARALLDPGADERSKQRMAGARRRGEFRMELARHEPR